MNDLSRLPLTSADPGPEPVATRALIPVGLKISAIVIAILMGLATITMVIVGRDMSESMLDEFRSKGIGIARGLATASVALLVRNDRPKVQSFVDEFSKTEGVAYVAINDPSGEIISHSLQGVFPAAIRDAIVGKEELTTQVTTAISRRQIEGFGEVLDISHPIMNGALGRAHVGMQLDRIRSRVWRSWLRLGVVFVVFITLGVILAYVLGRLVMRPVKEMIRVLGELSRGNLQARAATQTRDEFAALTSSLNAMIGSLRDIVSNVRAASVHVNDASEEIVATSRDQERGVRDQVSSLEETTQTMDALANTARAIAGNADGMTKLSEEMSHNVNAGQEALSASKKSVMQIVGQNQIIVDRINKLYEQSEAIISVIDIIDSISDRLDLLALNAALEGSRAGDVGKGFSLVAQEMRRLAENVTGSTREIKSTVQEIHSLTQAALEASHQGSDTTKEGAREMEKTVAVMSQIFDLIGRATDSARQILVITQQQTSSSEQIVAAMRNIAAISNQGVTAAQQVTLAAQDLAELSSSLRSRVSIFRLDGSTGAPAEPAARTGREQQETVGSS
jgi:methyl-accepting chemotaxis protein